MIREGYDRVTAVLDYFAVPELVEWKVRVGKKVSGQVSRAALKHGDEVDQIIKGKKKLMKSSPIEVQNCIKAFQRWQEDYQAYELFFPERLYDDRDMTTGEPDCIWKPRKILIDFKAAASIKPGYWVQTGKYRVMPASYERPEKTAILRLDKNLGIYEFKTNEDAGVDLDQCVRVFDGLREAYRFYRPNGPKEE